MASEGALLFCQRFPCKQLARASFLFLPENGPVAVSDAIKLGRPGGGSSVLRRDSSRINRDSYFCKVALQRVDSLRLR